MLNDIAYLIAYMGILAAIATPAGIIAWLIVRLIPDGCIDRWRTGKPTSASDRYTPHRNIKVDKRVYRLP